ncbi:MAG: DoxX family protein [Sphingobacteriaceae bacterium]
MKPLIVLLVSFIVSLLIIKAIRGQYQFALSARIAMAIMLMFTSIAHFLFNKGMAMMMPDFIPYKEGIVYLTGFIEIIAAIGLLVPGFRSITGWLLIVFFVMLLPANIYAALRHINYEKATFDGNGLSYLWFRIPLQFVFIVWVYISSIRY